MKCSVFIATSLDGYIATEEGSVNWLQEVGNQQADMSENPDMGFSNFIASIDCMIIGRKCMETISQFNLSPEEWPYGERKIYVLSKTLTEPPENLSDKVEMFSGDIQSLVSLLENSGYQHAYVDGGLTITSFINQCLIDEIIMTQAPVILGRGTPLFGQIDRNIKLANAKVTAFANDFIQTKYDVSYQEGD